MGFGLMFFYEGIIESIVMDGNFQENDVLKGNACNPKLTELNSHRKVLHPQPRSY